MVAESVALDPTKAMKPTAMAASVILEAVKVTGPMCSMPTLWNAKAVPHIIAVKINMMFPRIFLFFIYRCLQWAYRNIFRYSLGECPVVSRKALLKAVVDWKPDMKAHCVTESCSSMSKAAAFFALIFDRYAGKLMCI